MKKFIIYGGEPLKGEVSVSGAKNAVLPIMAATLLTSRECVIRNVPFLSDVFTMKSLLEHLGKTVNFEGNTMVVKELKKPRRYTAPYSLVSKMRASFCVMGPLLARHKKGTVSLPGGCVIGVRPVDLHIKGFRSLGINFRIDKGYIHGYTKEIRGNEVFLGGTFGPSVLATENIMMTAVLAKGTTLIENAACEPEVVDLAKFLRKMGASIKGEGTPWIKIEGVKSLGPAGHKVIPDRIETGTFILASLMTGGKVTIRNCQPDTMGALLDKMKEIGVDIICDSDTITVKKASRMVARNISTHPYPGFPTDLQAQYMSLMSIADGVCVIKENIFPDRFMHVQELNRMGANIQREGPYAVVEGKRELFGAEVMASDLRASAAMVLAGLRAKDVTTIQRIYHLERGYEDLNKKLERLGAKIKVQR